MDIKKELFANRDLKYRDFHASLVPNISKETIIGVRVPILRKLASELYKSGEYKQFIDDLPHKYFDENSLHSMIIDNIKDYDECIEKLNIFLPYVDNWATCDALSPKVFKKHKNELQSEIDIWLASDMPYTIRFGIKMLMDFYLDDDFIIEYATGVAAIQSNKYYVNMMIAWYFATALTKQYDKVIHIFENPVMTPWVHNKAIQKARESFRISNDKKEYLKSLKIKEK